MKKTIIILTMLVVMLSVEAFLTDQTIFAVTYFDNPKISSNIKATVNYSEENLVASKQQQKSRAPEPTTFLLILSGFTGILVRFARKSFLKFKRFSDIVLSLFGLLISLPVFIIFGTMIKLSSRGPVVYRQNRVGLNGKVFEIYKLRTMRLDAEKTTGAVWASENDPRITKLGRILRKTHLDEIPQLLNVLKGEMSIVGPRPERPEIVHDLKVLISDYEKRLKVRPGITGLAQVYQRYDETISDVKKKIKYDLLYIKKMCWLIEMRILARTFIVALTGKGAR